jgi:hypothetical protein
MIQHYNCHNGISKEMYKTQEARVYFAHIREGKGKFVPVLN